jgi:hypothetical protein
VQKMSIRMARRRRPAAWMSEAGFKDGGCACVPLREFHVRAA